MRVGGIAVRGGSLGDAGGELGFALLRGEAAVEFEVIKTELAFVGERLECGEGGLGFTARSLDAGEKTGGGRMAGPDAEGGFHAHAGLGDFAFLQILRRTLHESVGLLVEDFSVGPIASIPRPAEQEEKEKNQEKTPAPDCEAEADFASEFFDLGGGHFQRGI